MDVSVDTSGCPLCGASNHCIMAVGNPSATDCWCMTVRIPPELMARLPEELRDVSCLCADCLRAFEEEALPPSTTRR